jgi:ketosteroid isomerase-like protein
MRRHTIAMTNHTTSIGLILVSILAAVAVPGASAQRRRHHTNAVPEIRAVLDRQVDAWNRHDLEGFMDGYWKSPELTFFSVGTRRSGWQEAITGYRSRYQGEGHEMGRLDFSDLTIELLSASSGFARGHWHLTFTSGSAGGLFTLIFRKFPEGWRIIHDHTSSE